MRIPVVRMPSLLTILISVSGLLAGSGVANAVLPFERTGNLYVSMWTGDEIAVFSPDGTPLERFSAEGLDGPRGIAFNPANGEIWVAGEFSNAIFIFNHEHELIRKLEHADFNEPVGVTFQTTSAIDTTAPLVYISNSNGNELMVFDQSGALVRRFSAPALVDPNCSAFMQDGSFFVSNRLGGTSGTTGAVTRFDDSENFQFDFTATGMSSVMAVARDPNELADGADDSLWVTSGGGDRGIYEFDQSGNLLTTLLPGNIDDGRLIVPQGIAFDSDGNFVVVSFLNEVLKFDRSGNFLMRFATGTGTARSTAFQGCQLGQDDSGRCIPFGASPATMSINGMPDSSEEENGDTEGSATELEAEIMTVNNGSGGGVSSLLLLFVLSAWLARFQLFIAGSRIPVKAEDYR